MVKRTYKVRGEYGIQYGDWVIHYVQASTLEEAREKGIKLLKKNVHWDRIGTHNVYVTLSA